MKNLSSVVIRLIAVVIIFKAIVLLGSDLIIPHLLVGLAMYWWVPVILLVLAVAIFVWVFWKPISQFFKRS